MLRPRIAALLAVLACAGLAAEAPADLVFTGGAVYTVDPARSWAQAVAVRSGRILFVGTDVGVKQFVGPKTRVLKLGGRMLLPSFQDAHVHPISGGVELALCNLDDLPTAAAVLDKVRECVKEMAGKPWIVGGGWVVTQFPEGNPKRDALDAIATDKPIYLDDADGHSAWVNSKALALAGITKDTPDPKNGRIERDPQTGEPTGCLRESASYLVGAPKPTDAERLDGLRRALALFGKYGITAVQAVAEADAGSAADSTASLSTYLEAEKRGQLTARVVVALGTTSARGPEQVEDLVRLRREHATARVKPIAAKIFADGVIEPRTAAMLQDYTDRPGWRGEPNFTEAALDALVLRLAEADFNVHIHAIGDRAVRISLDAFEAARTKASARGQRHQIAHLQVIDPADIPRFRKLGVIANFQALWAYADDYIVDMTWGGLGPERSRWLYPIGSVVRAGGVLALGSDWSVSSLNPLDAIQVALTRQGIDEPKRAAMVPEEAIDLATALAGYTIGAAYANNLEKDTGSIEVGKAADLIVLSKNLFDVPAAEIAKQKVLLTLLEGQPVFSTSELAW
jgi:hypothetical protein